MFVIPFIKKPDWRKPPAVTITLILVNVLVFIGFQLRDEAQRERAIDFYLDSELPRIELPRYVRYVDARKDNANCLYGRYGDCPRLLSKVSSDESTP